ncbi:MAG: ATP-binding protein/SpoIIE family protein phosphatase [Candidatus Dactylopiibacterium sp.]|nr:ATP-binding protein/SpoIIE family protein phosphatase [Candidatus Dactylopiibacterium sp.]
MEVILGTHHVVFPVEESSRIGEARRHAVRLAQTLGFDETRVGRVALVVTELGTNLLKHAREGQLLIAARQHASAGIEILSVDRGPGMRDVAQSLRDGYSTAGSPGTGLGAISRLADDFDLHSSETDGTLIVARLHGEAPAPGRPAFASGVIAVCAPGETVCGDGWGIALDGSRAALLVADGLGHGPDAHEAAQAAVGVFAAAPFGGLREALETAHVRLRMTRGAALSTVIVDGQGGSIQSAGAGNVLVRLVSGTSDRTLLSQHGTVGVQIRHVEVIQSEWPEHASVIMHSDGLLTRWPGSAIRALLGRDPSLTAALLWRDYSRKRDDVTVAVLRRRN